MVSLATGGITATQLRDRMGRVSVEDPAFGASPAKTAAQNAVAIQAALDSGAPRIYFPNIYPIDTQLVVPGTVFEMVADGPGKGGVTFAFTGPAIRITRSTPTSLGTITGAITRGTQSLTLTTPPAQTPLFGRDVMIVSDDATTSNWSTWQTDFRKGEMPVIAFVSGSVIYIGGVFYDDYVATDVTIGRMHYEPFRMTDMYIEADEICVQAQYHNGSVFEGCTFRVTNPPTGASDGLELYQCANCIVQDCQATVESNVVGNRYPLVIANCQNIKVTSCRLISPAVGITLAGRTNPPTVTNPLNPNRQIVTIGCSFHASGYTGQTATRLFSVHGNCEDVLVQGNFFHGAGGGLAGDNITYDGNHFYLGPAAHLNQGLRATEPKGCNFRITNNYFYSRRPADVLFMLFDKFANAGFDRAGTLDFSRNTMRVEGGAPALAPVRVNQTGTIAATAAFMDVRVQDNSISYSDNGTPFFLRIDEPTSGTAICRDLIQTGNTCHTGDSVRITSDVIEATALTGLRKRQDVQDLPTV